MYYVLCNLKFLRNDLHLFKRFEVWLVQNARKGTQKKEGAERCHSAFMGNQLTAQNVSADYFVHDLPFNITFERGLGEGKE